MEDERIISLDGVDGYGSIWRIRLDLNEVASSAGMYRTEVDPENGRRYRDLLLKMSQARKICRLILQSGSEQDIAAADEAFRTNPKLLKAWEEEKRRFGNG